MELSKDWNRGTPPVPGIYWWYATNSNSGCMYLVNVRFLPRTEIQVIGKLEWQPVDDLLRVSFIKSCNIADLDKQEFEEGRWHYFDVPSLMLEKT